MSWFRKLFGGGDNPSEPARDLVAAVSPLVVPALRMRVSTTPTRSHIGGDPNLPADTPWPERHGRRLTLLARMSLPEVQKAQHTSWLPSDGALLFFYDVDEQPWGFDPKDRGGAAVLHVPDLPTPVNVFADAGTRDGVLAARNVLFHRVDSLPSLERAQEHGLLMDLSSVETDAYFQLAPEMYGAGPEHQLGGWPSPIQADAMELEAELASSGIYCGDAPGRESADFGRHQAAAKDWRLLLQLDSDGHMDVMWGDAGMLYLWVREQEAAAGRFENAWVVLQCH
jgi:uncharacterized protein YwqG